MAMMSPMTAAYGMPAMMQQGMVNPYGGMYAQQPVYFNSMSQLPPGAVPVSQSMLAQALGQAPGQGMVGSQMVQEQPSTISRMLKGAGIGAAAGAAFGVIPFLPLGLFSGALVGAGVGALIGLLRKPSKPEGEFHTMTPEQQQAMAQAQMIASTPPGARSAATTADGTAAHAERKAVVMGPEMRKKWAAKVQAEKAAAAKAAKH